MEKNSKPLYSNETKCNKATLINNDVSCLYLCMYMLIQTDAGVNSGKRGENRLVRPEHQLDKKQASAVIRDPIKLY